MRERAFLARLPTADGVSRSFVHPEPATGTAERFDVLRSLQSRLDYSGIELSSVTYLALSIVCGFAVFVLGLSVGPLFAMIAGPLCAYEAFVLPLKSFSAYRRRSFAEHLPVCLELLGECFAAGLPFERALVYTTNRLPKGPLASELGEMSLRIQRGAVPQEAIEQCVRHIRGIEARAFVASLKLMMRSEDPTSYSFGEFASFIRIYRASLKRTLSRVSVARHLFILGTVSMACAGNFTVEWLEVSLSRTFSVPNSTSFAALVKEIGGICILFTCIAANRLTSRYYWEEGDD